MSPNLAEKSQRHEKAKMFWASGHRRQILRLEKRKFSQVSKFVWPTSQVCFCRFVRLHSSEARRKIWGWSQKKPCFSFRLKLQTSFLFVFYSNLNQIHRETRKRKGEKHHQMCFFMFPNLPDFMISSSCFLIMEGKLPVKQSVTEKLMTFISLIEHTEGNTGVLSTLNSTIRNDHMLFRLHPFKFDDL